MLHSTARSGGNIDQLCHDLKTRLLLELPITITPWHFNQSDDNLTIFRLSDWSTFLSGCPSDLVYEGFRSYTSYLVVCFNYSKLWRPARSAANHQRSHPTNHQRPGPTNHQRPRAPDKPPEAGPGKPPGPVNVDVKHRQNIRPTTGTMITTGKWYAAMT